VIERPIREAERLDLIFESGLLLEALNGACGGASDSDPWQADPALGPLGVVSPPPVPPVR
jgi:hypothetical protein